MKSFLGLFYRVLTRVCSLIGPSYGIAKEKGGVQIGRGPQAFDKIKETLANAPVMMAPIAGKELKLYLAFNDNAIGIVLAQDDKNGQEKPIY